MYYYNEHFGGFMNEAQREELERRDFDSMKAGYEFYTILDMYMVSFETASAARRYLYKLIRNGVIEDEDLTSAVSAGII